MSDTKISAVVRAVVTIEFEVGTWDGGATFDSLNEQCSREATQILRNRFEGRAKIIGEPIIKVATFSQDKP